MMSKKFYKNIFTVACLKQEEPQYLNLHLENKNLIKRAEEKKDLLAFIYCDNKLKQTKVEKVGNYKNIINVTLPISESYNSLSNKTYETIKYFYKNFSFEYLFKGDITKLIELNIFDLDSTTKNPKDFIGCTAFKARRTRAGFYHHQGLEKTMLPCRRKTFKKWAAKRGLEVNEWMFDDSVYFSNWKPYAVSNKFAKLIASYGKPYVDFYLKELGGCEDHMIGKIWKDLSIAFGLTIR